MTTGVTGLTDKEVSDIRYFLDKGWCVTSTAKIVGCRKEYSTQIYEVNRGGDIVSGYICNGLATPPGLYDISSK